MVELLLRKAKNIRRRAVFIFAACLACACITLPLAAQVRGPMTPDPAALPPPAQPQPKITTAPQPVGPQKTPLGPPSIPLEEIIQKFAAKEAEFKAERDNFTYTQTFVVQTLDENGHVDGEFRQKSDIVFSPNGSRYEKVTYAPEPTLERVILTEEDFNDLVRLYPFVLTTEDVSNYDIKYVNHEPLDELTTYVFDVSPKAIGKGQRYFQGRIWVDDKDLQIVKTYGKAVGYSKKKNGQDQIFPKFETFRENIEGKYWFPTYTRADELHFGPDDVHFRMTVRYDNYQRYGVNIKIGKPTEIKDQNQK